MMTIKMPCAVARAGAITIVVMRARAVVACAMLMIRVGEGMSAVMIAAAETRQRCDRSSKTLHWQHQQQGKQSEFSEAGKHRRLV
jgi:hypothetical protein